MLKFREGQTYICEKSHSVIFTEGTEYKVFYDDQYKVSFDDQYKVFVIKDDTGFPWYDYEINQTGNKFKLKEESQSSDLIDNQSHYKNQGIEPIDLMRKNFTKEEFAGFLQGNVLKYMLRYKDKNGVEDLKKAKTYMTWLIKEEEK